MCNKRTRMKRTYLSSVTKQPFLLPGMCGEARCGFLFLWLTLLSDALDINIIVQQWPTQKTDLSLHISIRPAELSECTMLCCRLPQAVISFGPPCCLKSRSQTWPWGKCSRGFKSRNVCLVFSFKNLLLPNAIEVIFLSLTQRQRSSKFPIDKIKARPIFSCSRSRSYLTKDYRDSHFMATLRVRLH